MLQGWSGFNLSSLSSSPSYLKILISSVFLIYPIKKSLDLTSIVAIGVVVLSSIFRV